MKFVTLKEQRQTPKRGCQTGNRLLSVYNQQGAPFPRSSHQKPMSYERDSKDLFFYGRQYLGLL